jgi:ABC-type uncharacterized transport system permease subunit
MGIDFIIAAIITVVGLTTPILLAGLGELVVEKSGVLNLGVEAVSYTHLRAHETG